MTILLCSLAGSLGIVTFIYKKIKAVWLYYDQRAQQEHDEEMHDFFSQLRRIKHDEWYEKLPKSKKLNWN
jgi:hypothetical protein